MEKDVETRAAAVKDAFEKKIDPEEGLSYRLDLQIGSEMRSMLPNYRAYAMPVHPQGYGYFIAGPRHFTCRSGNAGQGLYQIFITYSGYGRFLIGDQEYIAGPNTLFMLKCGTAHRYESMGGVWVHEWVNYSGTCVQTYYDLICPKGPMVYDLGNNREIPLRMREVRSAMEKQDMLSYVHTGTQVIRLLDAAYSFVMEQQRLNLQDRRGNVERSIQYIDEHYMEKISLDDLAGIAYLSKYYYTRAFDKIVGMTPYEYLNTVRISKAMNLLILTGMSVDEIGWQVGFQGSRNLIRQFKKTMGITPGEYRKSAAMWNAKSFHGGQEKESNEP